MGTFLRDYKCSVCRKKKDLGMKFTGNYTWTICNQCWHTWYVKIFIGFANLWSSLRNAWRGH